MKDRPLILNTSVVDPELLDRLNVQHIVVDQAELTRICFLNNEMLQAELELLKSKPVTAIFTSANAVYALAEIQDFADNNWRIACIGHATKNAVIPVFGHRNIVAIADDAQQLASNLIATMLPDEVYFFCGSKRLETIPVSLRNAGFRVHEKVVYNSIATPVLVAKCYDGILFSSPGAVHSFFSNNKIAESTVLFAIGNTTAGALADYSTNKVIISEKPTKGGLILTADSYFYKNWKIDESIS